jgi:hypothetical protein
VTETIIRAYLRSMAEHVDDTSTSFHSDLGGARRSSVEERASPQEEEEEKEKEEKEEEHGMETKQSHEDDDSDDNSSHFIFNDTPPFQQATRKKYFWRNILSFISLTEQQRHEMKSFSTLLRDILPGLSYIYASFPHSKTKILTKLLSLVRRDKRVHDKLLIEIHKSSLSFCRLQYRWK